MSTRRPISSGRKDSLGRDIKVSGNADTAATAPPPPAALMIGDEYDIDPDAYDAFYEQAESDPSIQRFIHGYGSEFASETASRYAISDGHAVGAIHYALSETTPPLPKDVLDRSVQFTLTIAVSSEQRGQGIARRLLDVTAEELAAEAEHYETPAGTKPEQVVLVAEIADNNEASQALFERAGFTRHHSNPDGVHVYARADDLDRPVPASTTLTADEGIDYGDAAPRTASGKVVDVARSHSFGIQASSPEDRGEEYNDEDYVFENDTWTVEHGAFGSFETDRRTGKYSAYKPVMADGTKPVITSGALWNVECYDEQKAGRIWRNRGAISKAITAGKPGLVRSGYTYVSFNDDGTMTVKSHDLSLEVTCPAAP